jgi:HEAT repeat protein
MPIYKHSPTILISLLMTLSLIACAPATTKDINTYEQRGDIDKLIHVVNRGEKQVRIKAIRALGDLKDPRAVNTLIKALQSNSWVEREAAVIALGQINDYLSIKPLTGALGDSNQFVRERAAKELLAVTQSLAKEKNSHMVNILFGALESNDEYTRDQVALALQSAIDELKTNYRPYFIGQLLDKLNHPNRYVRREAARALGKFNDPRVVKPLLAAQKDIDTQVQIIASEGLQHIDNPRSMNSLLAALGSNNTAIRDDAIEALKKFSRPEEIQRMLQTLHTNNSRVREGIVHVLGESNHPVDAQKFIPLLKDNDVNVRKTTANVLQKAGWQPVADHEKSVFCVAQQNWGECGEYGDAAIQPLLFALHDIDPEVRENAGAVLSSLNWNPVTDEEKSIDCVMRQNWDKCVALGKAAVNALVRELNTPDISKRQNIISSLAKIKDRSVIKPLISALHDDDSGVRMTVVNALGQFNYPLVITTLIHTLDDNNYYVRQAALTALENNIDTFRKDENFDASSPLLKSLKDNNRNVRLAAAKLLGKLKDPKTIRPLITALEDQDRDVREESAASLAKIKNPAAIPQLVDGLKSDNSIVRTQILQSLAGFNDPRVYDPLFNSLSDKNDYVKQEAIKGLGKIDDKRTISPLIKMLETDNIEIQQQAIIALGNKNDPRIIEPLKKFLTHKKAGIREATGQSLIKLNWQPSNKKEESHYCIIRHDWLACEKLGQFAVNALITELLDPESSVREECARTLGLINDKKAIRPLIKSIEMTQWAGNNEDNAALLKTLKKALVKFESDAIPDLLNNLTHWYSGHYVAQVLRSIGWIPATDTEVVHYQVALRDREKLLANWALTNKILQNDIAMVDEHTKSTALYALIGLGKEESISLLVSTLKNSSSVSIAEAYINSGNDHLKSAALSWTASHNLSVDEYTRGNNPILWGAM